MATTLNVSADAQPECIRPLRNLVASLAHDEGLSDVQVYAVKVCVSEAIANSVKHAYRDGDRGPVEVNVHEADDELVVTVVDRGRDHQRVSWKERGGFGLAFVCRLTDGCTFTAAESGTSVEMLFPLPGRDGVEQTVAHGHRLQHVLRPLP